MTQFIDIVNALYQKPWVEAKSIALEIVPVGKAPQVITELASSPGWRERVAAASVISAFELYSLAPLLIKTFNTNPEVYTCSSFVLLLNDLQDKEQQDLKEYMLACCPEGNYGDYLCSIVLK